MGVVVQLFGCLKSSRVVQLGLVGVVVQLCWSKKRKFVVQLGVAYGCSRKWLIFVIMGASGSAISWFK